MIFLCQNTLVAAIRDLRVLVVYGAGGSTAVDMERTFIVSHREKKSANDPNISGVYKSLAHFHFWTLRSIFTLKGRF